MENHFLQMENKNKLSITEITGVEGFDEETILVSLKAEELVISGKNLHIESLDLDEGVLSCSGQIESLVYTRKKKSGRCSRDCEGGFGIDRSYFPGTFPDAGDVLLRHRNYADFQCQRLSYPAHQRKPETFRGSLPALVDFCRISVQRIYLQRLSRGDNFVWNSIHDCRHFIVEKNHL